VSYIPPSAINRLIGNTTNLWALPEVPNALDDEFQGVALDPAWQLSAGLAFNATPIDTYDTVFPAGEIRVDYNNNRRSWMQIQPPPLTTTYLTKDIGAIPDPFLVYAGMRTVLRGSAWGNNDGRIGLVLGDSNAGNFDDQEYVRCMLVEPDPSVAWARSQRIIGGGVTNVNNSNNVASRGFAFQYAAIQRIGATTYFYVASEDGNWLSLGQTNHPNVATFNRIGFIAESRIVPPLVAAWDFIRVITGTSSFSL
jgi:hypothetical protein